MDSAEYMLPTPTKHVANMCFFACFKHVPKQTTVTSYNPFMGQDGNQGRETHISKEEKQSFSGILGKPKTCFYLVVEPTHLKNISQNRNIPQLGVKNQTYLSCHHLVFFYYLKISDPKF